MFSRRRSRPRAVRDGKRRRSAGTEVRRAPRRTPALPPARGHRATCPRSAAPHASACSAFSASSASRASFCPAARFWLHDREPNGPRFSRRRAERSEAKPVGCKRWLGGPRHAPPPRHPPAATNLPPPRDPHQPGRSFVRRRSRAAVAHRPGARLLSVGLTAPNRQRSLSWGDAPAQPHRRERAAPQPNGTELSRTRRERCGQLPALVRRPPPRITALPPAPRDQPTAAA